jgi:hypothetical protein
LIKIGEHTFWDYEDSWEKLSFIGWIIHC